ncbi:hypothetical protein MAL1_00215 [Bacteriophage DSS3_MAL1]|nr:hypothetical protein MAL1_00215 [Bacteriophage DSS3_MAL1]
MPCNSDHMEPTVRERQHREAAQHLVYIYGAMNQPVPAQVAADAAHIYGGSAGEINMNTLCSLLRGMSEEQLSRIVYDGRNPQARKLADWWDEHQREDWKRREEEAKKAKSFDTCLRLAQQYLDGGYAHYDVAAKIAEVTGMYYDHDNSTHFFEFEDGVIILSGMDGLTAYKGKRV